MTWLPILSYHRIVPWLPQHAGSGRCIEVDAFERQLRWLSRRGYRSLTLAQLEFAMEQPGSALVPPGRSVVITFDGGYRDNYLYAWPLLLRYGFTATIFLVSDTIGRASTFGSAESGPSARMLDRTQILEMQRYGISFGSHSCSHPLALPDLSDGELRRELEGSKSALEALLGGRVDYCAYPNSRFDARVSGAVERAGYRLGCAGPGAEFSRFSLHRVDPQSRGAAALELQIAWCRLRHHANGRARGPVREPLFAES
jgi:peptidoglycan/xylan/chitin deacetylase (PgdA/CDA1 family)